MGQNPVLKALEQGRREGRRELRIEVLTYLEGKYMDPSVERKTPLAEGILEIAKELAEMMRA